MMLLQTPSSIPRSSSPLNPASTSQRSSSPMTSPTPHFQSGALMSSPTTSTAHYVRRPAARRAISSFAIAGPSNVGGSSTGSTAFASGSTTRYRRPVATKRHSLPPGTDLFGSPVPSPNFRSLSDPSAPSSTSTRAPRAHVFADATSTATASGSASPMQNLIWGGRLNRRAQERERRRQSREGDLDRRRSLSSADYYAQMTPEQEAEADRQAEQDDEEIYRRIMIMQQKRAEHALLVSYELETGGSDPNLPEFWADELEAIDEHDEDDLFSDVEGEHESVPRDDGAWSTPQKHQSVFQTPLRPTRPSHQPRGQRRRNPAPAGTGQFGSLRDMPELDEEDRWAMEAAEAEAAELAAEQAAIEAEERWEAERADVLRREQEDAEIARRVEEAYGIAVSLQSPAENGGGGMDMDMDWEAFDAMDIE